MEPIKYDLIVIGSGPAGEKGAAKAAYFGKRVAIVERRPDGATWQPGTQRADVRVTGPAQSLLLTLTRGRTVGRPRSVMSS